MDPQCYNNQHVINPVLDRVFLKAGDIVIFYFRRLRMSSRVLCTSVLVFGLGEML